MDNCSQEIRLLFETSWEVCNKIGGIYTVLSSKAKTLVNRFKDNVIFIGPDVWTDENPSMSFIEDTKLLRKWAENTLLPEGVDIRVGRWDIPGSPIAILVKFDGIPRRLPPCLRRLRRRMRLRSCRGIGNRKHRKIHGNRSAKSRGSL